MKQDVQKLFDLGDERNALQSAWYRQLLTIASAGLALLVGLRPEIPQEGNLRYLLAAAWLFLGLGIVFGSAATYADASRSKNLTENFRKELQKALQSGIPMSAPVLARPHWFFLLSKKVMIFSLLLSVISFVSYSVVMIIKC